jgi:hypothetical protein
MSRPISTGAFLRPLFAAALLIDFFLYSTGNPSIAYSILRGWFLVDVFAFFGLSAYALSRLRKGKEERAPFAGFLFSVVVVTALLLLVSERATEIGAAGMENEVVTFLRDPRSEKFRIDPQERTLAQDVLTRRCEHTRESFIPTFRRIDYLFTCPDRQKYRLVLSKRWNGELIVSFRMVVS